MLKHPRSCTCTCCCHQCMADLFWCLLVKSYLCSMLSWVCVHSLGPVMVEQASAYWGQTAEPCWLQSFSLDATHVWQLRAWPWQREEDSTQLETKNAWRVYAHSETSNSKNTSATFWAHPFPFRLKYPVQHNSRWGSRLICLPVTTLRILVMRFNRLCRSSMTTINEREAHAGTWPFLKAGGTWNNAIDARRMS